MESVESGATVDSVEDQEELGQLITAITDANHELVDASAHGDLDRVEALVRDVRALERRRDRLVAKAGLPSPGAGGYEASIPVRDQVIRALHLAGHPAAHRLLADITRARTGETLPTAALASLRRDEARSWANGQDVNRRTATRDVYVVPALGYDRLAPVRGTLALSSWSVARRLIAPLSPRVDLLRITIRLADEAAAMSGGPFEPQLRRLVARLGSTVPGVVPFGAEPQHVAEAARSELAQLEELDDQQRADAADRAFAQLGPQALLFGAATSVVKTGPARPALSRGHR